MLRFTKTVTRRTIDGTEIRIPEGALVVKDTDGWRFLSPRPLIVHKLSLEVPLEGCTIRLRQASLPIKTPEQEDKVLVFRRKGNALFVNIEAKSVDITCASITSNISVWRRLEHKIAYAEIPVKINSTVLVISHKLNVIWNKIPTMIHAHNNNKFYGIEFTTKDDFNATLKVLSKIVANNSKLVKRINWGVKDNRLTFQLWFKKIN